MKSHLPRPPRRPDRDLLVAGRGPDPGRILPCNRKAISVGSEPKPRQNETLNPQWFASSAVPRPAELIL